MKPTHLLTTAVFALMSTSLMAQAATQQEMTDSKKTETVASKPENQPASNAQILRDKIKADKKFVVAKNMKLTEAESSVFWPVYEAYQQDLSDINKRMGKLFRSYGEAYKAKKMNDDLAKKLIQEALDIQEAETTLMRTYVPKLNAVLSATKAMRYLQIENKIRAIEKYELTDVIPLAR